MQLQNLSSENRRPGWSFRGLKSVHSHAVPSAERVAKRPICLEGQGYLVSSPRRIDSIGSVATHVAGKNLTC